MRRIGFIWIVGICLLVFVVPIRSQEISDIYTDSLSVDSFAIDSYDPDPEWYVAPVIPASLRAPMRTSATSACSKVAAIRTYDIDSKLVEGIYYEYDNAGRVTSTTIWVYNEDSTKIGKSKQEYGFDAYDNQVSTVVYDWDTTANIWHGISRYEYTYDAEQYMLSNTEYAWVNNEWVADTKYTWAHDAEGRETEYFYYTRDVETNQLVPVSGFIYTWLNDTQKSLEIIYTVYSNGAWSEGTKKIWEYDTNGNNTLYEYYASISNGNWIGDTRERWEYNDPNGKNTYYEKQVWRNGTWGDSFRQLWEFNGPNGKQTYRVNYSWSNVSASMLKTLESTDIYDSDGNVISREYYIFSNGVPKGVTYFQYTYENKKPIQYNEYTWKDGAWNDSIKHTWEYNGPNSKITKYEEYEWNDAWVIMMQKNTAYNGNTTTVENYKRIAGVWTGIQKEENTVIGGKPTQTIIYAWNNGIWDNASKETWGYTSGVKTSYEKLVWENDTWTGTEKEVWGYTGTKQTLHETYEWYNNDWSVTLREISGYDAAGNKNSVENYTGSEGVLTAVLKEEYTFNSAKEVIVTVKYKWSEGVWVKDTKHEVGYKDGNTEYSEANYTWDGSAWVGIGNKTVTVYVGSGNNVSAAWAYAWSTVAGDWVYAAQRICEYDSKGRSIGDTTYLYTNSVWEYNKLQTHGYDAHDNDTLAVTATWNGTEWVPTEIFKGTFTYNEFGDMLLYETYKGLEGAWVGQKKRVWEYNEFGSQTLYRAYEWKSKKWTDKEKREQVYDVNNHLLLDQSFTWNKKWEGTDKYEYAYDTDEQQCMSAHYIWLNGGWYGISKSEQVLDEHGVVLTSFSYSWSTNKWEYTFKYEYDYDEEGRKIDEKTSRWRNSDWTNYLWVTHAYYGSGKNAEEIATYEYMWKSGWQLISMHDKKYDESIHKTRTEENGLWNSSTLELVSYTNDHYFYDCDPHFYTIRFVNYDGEVLANMTAQEGETPTYVGSNPTREGNAEYSYTFSGWNPTLGPVTSNVTYTATFTATKNTYTITWKNEDGTQIDQTTAEYGTMPTHEDASKANTAEYTYTFAGWTPTIAEVTGDATYTASFTATKNKYLITFKDEDGTTLKSEELEYGVMPTAPANPTKAATGGYLYTFSGWTPEIVSVTSEATYTATFTATKNTYTITWKNEDGSIIESETLTYGTTPTHEDINKESTAEYTYTFVGWTPGIGIVTGDATYTATFTATKNKYLITFKDEDGSVLKSEELEYGVTPTAPSDPTKASTAEDTYTFAGWGKEVVTVTEAATYTAAYTTTKNSYTITWKNEDGSIIESETLAYGAMPTHADINKESTAEYTYTFAGWTPQITAVTGDAEYTATYTATKKSYTITWKDEDGSIIESETLEYGTTPAHADIYKESTAEYTYTFAGWTPAIASVTGDATYTATFTATKNKYLITFKDEDGSILKSEELEYGVMPTAPSDPTKAATAEWTYTFAGWDKEIISVAEATTYTATYTATKNSYTITWKNEDGSIIESETLAYGTTPTHADINKESTAEYTYTFAGWTPGIGIVTGDAEYTATFSATKNSYTITWLNEDGSEIEHETLEYGATPAHADMTKENTAEFTYTFTGWTPGIGIVTGDASYTATFSATKNKYTITWLDDDNTQIDQTSVEYGVIPTHDDPTKAATAEFTYTFTGWDNTPIAVVGEATYKATYSAAKNSYTITWLDGDDSSLGTSTVEYGIVPTHDDPTKQPTAQYGYTFAGWSPAISAVTGNVTYKAMYTDTINQYTISWLDDTGTLVDQTKVAYGATPAHANIHKESDDQYDYTFVGWTPTLVPVTGDASYSAIFTTAGKSYTVTFYFADGVTILDQMTLPYGAIPSTPYIPSIPSDANHTYSFSGWSPEIAPVTGDISYVPTFTAIPNQYTVIFRNYNGKELQRKKVDYGTIPEYEGDEPSRPATNAYTWAFEGWTPELTAVIGDATYTAVYTKVMNTYTILFYDEDGTTLLDEVTVEHGQKPTTSVIPTKEADEEYRYTFAGWSPKIAKATSDAEYTATYLATPKTQGLNNTEAEGAAIKVIIEDKIYIRRGGNTYSIDGQRVK